MASSPSLLIVNDNANNIENIYKPFIRDVAPDLHITTAFDAEEALQKVTQKPDILLLDVTIPRSIHDSDVTADGQYIHSQEVAEAFLKENPNGHILLVSSYAKRHLDEYPEGTKAIDINNLIDSLQEHILAAMHKPAAIKEETPAKTHIEPSEKHLSRVAEIRRSGWHTASKEGCDDAWTVKTGSTAQHVKTQNNLKA